MANGPVYSKLTKSEKEILALAAAGKNRREIADSRGTKLGTIDNQLESIRTKMRTRSYGEALRRARADGQM